MATHPLRHMSYLLFIFALRQLQYRNDAGHGMLKGRQRGAFVMFVALQVVTVVVVAVAMALVVAHVLELPGKMRLSKEEYLAVQPIYYPGFTIGGIAEPLGLVLLLGLAIAMPIGSAMFWLTAGAFLA